MPLQHAHDGDLADRARPARADAARACVGVHVARLAADVGFVHFHVADSLPPVVVLHRQPNAVQHEPRGLLRDAKRPRQISCELTPFFMLAIIHTAGSHLSRPSGESSKMVPVLSVNFRFGWRVLHSQPLRDESK